MINVEVFESGAKTYILFHQATMVRDDYSLYDFTDLDNIHQTLKETQESLFIASSPDFDSKLIFRLDPLNNKANITTIEEPNKRIAEFEWPLILFKN